MIFIFAHHHRIRIGYSQCQHPDRGSGRYIRSGSALSTAWQGGSEAQEPKHILPSPGEGADPGGAERLEISPRIPSWVRYSLPCGPGMRGAGLLVPGSTDSSLRWAFFLFPMLAQTVSSFANSPGRKSDHTEKLSRN